MVYEIITMHVKIKYRNSNRVTAVMLLWRREIRSSTTTGGLMVSETYIKDKNNDGFTFFCTMVAGGGRKRSDATDKRLAAGPCHKRLQKEWSRGRCCCLSVIRCQLQR